MTDKQPLVRLVTIDLVDAHMPTEDLYDAAIRPLLQKHKSRLEFRVRAKDRPSETHLWWFPSAAVYEKFRADPQRVLAQEIWNRSNAKMTSVEVTRINS
jgi:hypothetical protein